MTVPETPGPAPRRISPTPRCRSPGELLQVERREMADEGAEMRLHRLEGRAARVTVFVHVERAIDLDLERVLAPRGIAIVARRVAAGIGHVAVDGIAEAPELGLGRERQRGMASGAIRVAEHEVDAARARV